MNPTNICPRCGAEFACGMKAGQESCWCASLPALAVTQPDAGCYCPACLRQLTQAQEEKTQAS